MAQILIVDDEEDIRWALSRLVQVQGWEPVTASSGSEALVCIKKAQPDVVLLDLLLPELNGQALVTAIHTYAEDIPIIVITGHGSMQDAVKMVKAGVYDYMTKPFDNNHVILTIRHAFEELQLKREVFRLREKAHELAPLCENMGNGKAVQLINSQVSHVAQTDFTVLISGATGTGKELVAHAIHDCSPRCNMPFIAVDCGAIPEALMEGELFGHEKGAYTGADKVMAGAVELASGGTLFLDEIGNMPFAMQNKFLRVLETKKIHRLGSSREIKVDFRVVAATNENLNVNVEQKTFRLDLYHRLAEFMICLPPLRERREDLPYLVRRILMITNQELKKNVRGLSGATWDLIQKYDWPGNVRELRNVLRRGVLLCNDQEIIAPEHLMLGESSLFTPGQPDQPVAGASTRAAYEPEQEDTMDGLTLKGEVQRAVTHVERMLLIKALDHSKGNKAHAARLLQIDYKTIHYKLREYGIEWQRPISASL